MPSKAVTISESALGQSTVILSVAQRSRDLVSLYHDVAGSFATVDDFILALDLLYTLGRLDVDLQTRVVTYAG